MAILAVDDVMLREPRLLVPQMEPLGPVKIDWSNPLAVGMKACYRLQNAAWRDLAGTHHGTDGVRTTLPTIGVYAGIHGAIFDATNGIELAGIKDDPTFVRNRDWTVFVVCAVDSLAADRAFFCAGTHSIETRFNTNGKMSLLDANQADILASSNTIAVGNKAICSVSCDASGNVLVWLNGVQTSGSTAANFTDSLNDTRPYIGCHYYTSSIGPYDPFSGVIALVGFAHIAWSASQHAAFWRDPYQFLIPA